MTQLLNALKTYSLSALMAGAAVMGSLPLNMPVTASAATSQKISEDAAYAEDDLFNPKGDLLIEDNPQADEIWREIKENRKLRDEEWYLPKAFKKLVQEKRNKIMRQNCDYFCVNPTAGMNYVVYQTDNLGIYYGLSRHGFYVYPRRFGAAEWIAPQKTPAVNPLTRKPYVAVSPKTMARLSKQDKAHVTTLTDVLNENLHYMLSPIPQLTEKDMLKGAYVGQFLLIPALFKPDSLEYPSANPMLTPGDRAEYKADEERWAKRNKKKGLTFVEEYQLLDQSYGLHPYTDEETLTQKLADGNAAKFALQKRLGAPLWNIKEDFKNVKSFVRLPFCLGMSQMGGADRGYPFTVIPMAFVDQRKEELQAHGMKRVYEMYFNAMARSFETLKEDWAAELAKEGLSKGVTPVTPRQQALTEIDAALGKIIQQAEKTLVPHQQFMTDVREGDEAVNDHKLPYSLLDPKGKRKVRVAPVKVRRAPVSKGRTNRTTSRQYGD